VVFGIFSGEEEAEKEDRRIGSERREEEEAQHSKTMKVGCKP
jgi:hypothetical protein